MSAPMIVNVDQASGWDGPEGDFWTQYEERFNGTMRPHFDRMRAMAAVSAGERVLDIGCGCGESTREAARAAQPGHALGVDLSVAMLKRARDRSQAEGLVNVRFEQADAQAHRFEQGAFDVVISRFGSMFFSDPVAAFRNIRRALRPGGRLVLLVWRELKHNEWGANREGQVA
jgi:ubiquinone/menaquinone biosynthesis C-methylase UbiE